jgi:hypothetical protein
MRVRVEGDYGDRIEYALERLASSAAVELGEGEADIIAGTPATSETVGRLIRSGRLTLADVPEAMAVVRDDDNRVVAAGSDEQGLMYALLEIGEQLELDGGSISVTQVAPETRLRGIFTFLHNADCEREWFASEEHWSAYLDLLADSRFNSFQLVMGHQTNYLAPPFPFFVAVPEHPEVVVPGLSAAERDRNLAALRMITELAARRGLAFVLGIWQVIAWWPQSRGGHTQRSMVDGLSWENLADYTYHATRHLLAAVPAIKGLQLRVNGESGVPEQHQTEFFSSTIFRAMAENPRPVFLDLRGWIAKEETIAAARRLDIPMRLSMKYWAEHLGAPYQAAEQEPAYSYADFLRYPRDHPVSYQVWALGSHRHFVWGDPDYVRTFTRSLHMGDGLGFEISPPLAQKGYGNEPGAWRVLHPDREHYRWEWERYWLYHILFGRISYDGGVSDEPWMRRLRARFGAIAEAVLDAHVAGSQIVSFLIRFNMSDPNMYIWPEADTGGLADFYLSVPPSDPARMKGFIEASTEEVSGTTTARLGPRWAADHLTAAGRRCLKAVSSLSDVPAADQMRRRELAAAAADVEALGELALYHADKIRAAYSLALYNATGERGLLHDARWHLDAARPHWERLAAVTDAFYTDHQVTGPVDSGHWKDKLVLVAEDEQRLDERIELHRRHGSGALGGAVAAFDFGRQPPAGYTYTRIPAHHDMVERGFIGVDGDTRWRYRGLTDFGWEALSGTIRTIAAPLARFCDRHLDTVFRDTMADPGYDRLVPFIDTLHRDYVGGNGAASFHAVVPAGTHEVTVVLCDRSEDPADHGPFDVTVNGTRVAGSLRVPAGELVELRSRHELDRGLVTVAFHTEAAGDWFCTAIVVRPLRPRLAHVRRRAAVSGEPLPLRLSTTALSPIAQATVHIATASGIAAIPMAPGDDECHHAVVDPSALGEEGILRYRFSVATEEGHTAELPEPDETDPRPWFQTLVVTAGRTAPRIIHDPIFTASPGIDIDVSCDIEADGPLTRAVLHYRYANQYYAWNRVALQRQESGSTWRARIPGRYVVPHWDLMYYLEAVDDAGVGSLVPGGENLMEIPYWVVRPER